MLIMFIRLCMRMGLAVWNLRWTLGNSVSVCDDSFSGVSVFLRNIWFKPAWKHSNCNISQWPKKKKKKKKKKEEKRLICEGVLFEKKKKFTNVTFSKWVTFLCGLFNSNLCHTLILSLCWISTYILWLKKQQHNFAWFFSTRGTWA